MSIALKFIFQTLALAASAALLLAVGIFAADEIARGPCDETTYAAFVLMALPSLYFQLFTTGWLAYIILLWSGVRASFQIGLALQAVLVIGTVTYVVWPSLAKPAAICE